MIARLCARSAAWLRRARDGGRRERSSAAVVLALVAAAIARLGTVDWDAPFRFHVDELGFVFWVAAHAEWRGFVLGSFEPTVTTYGPLVYELALAIKWLLSGTAQAREAAQSAADGWAYLAVLDDPAQTPLTMMQWIRAMRVVSACAGVLTVGLVARASRRLAGPEAGAITAWLSALAPGLVQVSHFYTPDGLLLCFEALVLDAASVLVSARSRSAALAAGVGIGLILATKMTGALVALMVPWALIVRGHDLGASRGGRLVRAAFAEETWLAVAASLVVFALFNPWAIERGPAYFSSGSGPTSGAFMLGTLYETDFGFYDWRFVYRDEPRGWTFFTSLVPYAVGWPATLAAFAGLVGGPRRARLLAWGALLPTAALVSGWTVLTIRYALPLVPPLVVSAGAWLGELWNRANGGALRGAFRSRRAAGVERSMVALVLAASLARGFAWSAMFLDDDPRTQASRWIAAHARAGDVVVTEPDLPYTAPLGAPDEPTGAPPYPMPRLIVRRLFAGGVLDASLPAHLERTLSDARFLVVSDWFLRRARSPSARWVSPGHAQFYEALLAGRTGFVEVARFERVPRLGPLRWDESREEQLAVCFDHCPVRVFERTARFEHPLRATAPGTTAPRTAAPSAASP